MNVKLADIINTTSAISPRTGQIAYDQIAKLLSEKKEVILSFEGITDCTSAFCNSFIGKLYMNLDPEQVDRLLKITNVAGNHVWAKKIHNARLLGTNENIRTIRKSSIDDLILS